MKRKILIIILQTIGIIILLYCSNILESYIKPERVFEYDPFFVAFIVNIPFYFVGILLGFNTLIKRFLIKEKLRINISIIIFTFLGIAYSLSYKILFSYITFYPLFLLNEKTLVTWNIFVGYIFITHIFKNKQDFIY